MSLETKRTTRKKKTQNSFIPNQSNGRSRSESQSGQILSKSKKDFCLHHKPQGQSSNIPTIN